MHSVLCIDALCGHDKRQLGKKNSKNVQFDNSLNFAPAVIAGKCRAKN